MGINEGCSACHIAQTGEMKIAPEGGSESVLGNKRANRHPLLLVISERGRQKPRGFGAFITLIGFVTL